MRSVDTAVYASAERCPTCLCSLFQMPHESTVNHEGIVSHELRRLSLCNRSRTIAETSDEEKPKQRPPLTRDESLSNVPHAFAATPQRVTQVADDLLEDEHDVAVVGGTTDEVAEST